MKSKKFLIKSTNDVLHIGNLIAWIIQENKIKKKDISNALQILPTTLNQYFKQPSVQTAILWRLSLATNYNFLMYLGEKLNIAYETKTEVALKQEIATKNEQIKKMEIELELFKIHQKFQYEVKKQGEEFLNQNKISFSNEQIRYFPL